jgi:transcriptional regulator with XRE-family HTH domain
MAKTLEALKADLLADPEVRAAYDEQALEYALARAIIAARTAAGLSQEQLAKRMNTQQSFIARLESGRSLPSMRTMQKLAEATGTRMELRFRNVSETSTTDDIGSHRDPQNRFEHV